MRFLGIDPDLHTTAIAVIGEDCRVEAIRVARVSDKFKGRDAVEEMIHNVFYELCALHSGSSYLVSAVESQEIVSSSKRGANPCDLLDLAYVTGAAVAMLPRPCYMPKPQEWKGSVPKHIHQARIARRAGAMDFSLAGGKSPYVVPTGWTYPVPSEVIKLKKSDWKHVMDAIGLALWAKDEYERRTAFDKRKAQQCKEAA